jgi:hypothetical protein
MASRRVLASLDQDRADQALVEPEDKAEIGALRRSLGDPSRDGQCDAGDKVMRWIVLVAVVAEAEFLAALSDQAEGREGYAMRQPGGRGCTMEMKPWERLDRPISTDSPREMLDQLITAGLRPVQRAL